MGNITNEDTRLEKAVVKQHMYEMEASQVSLSAKMAPTLGQK